VEGVLASRTDETGPSQSLRRYLCTIIREAPGQRWVGKCPVSPSGRGSTLLEPDALTLGFARSLTGYQSVPESGVHDRSSLLAQSSNAAERRCRFILPQVASADDMASTTLQSV